MPFLPGSGLTGGPCFCSTAGNKGIADDIGIRLFRRRFVEGVEGVKGVDGVEGEQHSISSGHASIFISKSVEGVTTLSDFISESTGSVLVVFGF